MYPPEFSLLLINYLVHREQVGAKERRKFLTTDLIGTTAVHGAGLVPKEGGWYEKDEATDTYRVNPDFSCEWRMLGIQ